MWVTMLRRVASCRALKALDFLGSTANAPLHPPAIPCSRHYLTEYCAFYWQNKSIRFQHRVITTTSTQTTTTSAGLESVHEYHQVADATLEDLYESLADLGDQVEGEYDVELSQGVLTVTAGTTGIYVINTQTPNRQIWMSSPISGPWRYDWDVTKTTWVSTRDGHSLRDRLKDEFSKICQRPVSICEKEPSL